MPGSRRTWRRRRQRREAHRRAVRALSQTKCGWNPLAAPFVPFFAPGTWAVADSQAEGAFDATPNDLDEDITVKATLEEDWTAKAQDHEATTKTEEEVKSEEDLFRYEERR